MFTGNNQLHTEQSSNCTMHVCTKELLDYQQLSTDIVLLLADTDNRYRYWCISNKHCLVMVSL